MNTKTKVVAQDVEAVRPTAPTVVNSPAATATPKGWKTRDEYRAYMRDYMRSYRLRKREGK